MHCSGAPMSPPFHGGGRDFPRLLDEYGKPLPPHVVLQPRAITTRAHLARDPPSEQAPNTGLTYERDILKQHFEQRAEAALAACRRKVTNEQERKVDALAQVLLNPAVAEPQRESRAVLNPLAPPMTARVRHYHVDKVWTHAAADPPCKEVTPRVAKDLDWKQRLPLEQAAARFDSDFRNRLIRAGRIEHAARTDESSTTKANAMRAAAGDLRRHRFYVIDVPIDASRPLTPRVSVARAPKPEDWNLQTSIWAPRAEWCDSHDFYDSEACRRSKFKNVWKRALAVGLGNFIVKSDDDDDDDGVIDDDDNDGIPDEIQQVEVVLWQNSSMLFAIFDVFTALGSSMTFMDFNEWTEMVKDFKLAKTKLRHCKSVDLDRIFIAVDAASTKLAGTTRSQEHQERYKSLSIAEFICGMVRIAVARYIASGNEKDVSVAVEKLCTSLLAPHVQLNTFLREPNDSFRKRWCYTQEVDGVLRKHERSLRTIFNTIAVVDVMLPAAVRDEVGPLLSYQDWGTFVCCLGLVAEDLSDRESNFCFVASRMSIANPYSVRGHEKTKGLPFEGFLEAMIRVAGLKGFPTDEDIVANGFKDAGNMMKHLIANDVPSYKRIVANCAQWGEEPPQPLWRCIDHLLSVVIRNIEVQTAGADDMKLTRSEVTAWWSACKDSARVS